MGNQRMAKLILVAIALTTYVLTLSAALPSHESPDKWVESSSKGVMVKNVEVPVCLQPSGQNYVQSSVFSAAGFANGYCDQGMWSGAMNVAQVNIPLMGDIAIYMKPLEAVKSVLGTSTSLDEWVESSSKGVVMVKDVEVPVCLQPSGQNYVQSSVFS